MKDQGTDHQSMVKTAGVTIPTLELADTGAFRLMTYIIMVDLLQRTIQRRIVLSGKQWNVDMVRHIPISPFNRHLYLGDLSRYRNKSLNGLMVVL